MISTLAWTIFWAHLAKYWLEEDIRGIIRKPNRSRIFPGMVFDFDFWDILVF